MTPKKQVSPAIRILRGERDASARATHLEAATRKFLEATNERKYMSTKTNFKRIALVAVAALGLGVLSSVPSQAIVLTDNFTVTSVAGTATRILSDSTTAATLTVKFTSTAADTVSVSFAGLSKPSDATTTPLVDIFGSTAALMETASASAANGVDTSTSTGATAVQVFKPMPGSSGATTSNDTAVITGVANQFNSATFLVSMDSVTGTRVPGTYTYTAIVTPHTTAGVVGTAKTATVTITIASLAAESTVPSAATSSAIISATGGSASDSSLAVVSTASTTSAAVIEIKLRNASGSSSTVAGKESVTVTTTAGTVGVIGGTFGRSVVLAYTNTGVAAATDSLTVQVRPDGTTGVATISISTPSITFSAKTVTFFAAAAKTLTATVAHPVLIVGANSGAVRATGLDANSIAWAGTAYIYASTAADALIAGSATTPVACAWDATNSRHNCPVTAVAPGTAKLKVIDASTVASATATSNEISVTVSSAAAASVKLSFDKASYAPNERARIYVTPVDSAGKEIGAGTLTNLLASGGITVNAGFSGSSDTLTAVSITTSASSSSTTGAKAGSAMYTVYMPAAGGVVTLTATGGASLPLSGQVAVTASATVTDAAASALAAVTALATTVASLKTLITTLTNLVLKIQKKVKA